MPPDWISDSFLSLQKSLIPFVNSLQHVTVSRFSPMNNPWQTESSSLICQYERVTRSIKGFSYPSHPSQYFMMMLKPLPSCSFPRMSFRSNLLLDEFLTCCICMLLSLSGTLSLFFFYIPRCRGLEWIAFIIFLNQEYSLSCTHIEWVACRNTVFLIVDQK
jgi:hypothetical protein